MNEAPRLPPPARYGRPRLSRADRRRVGIVLGALGVAGGLLVAALGYRQLGHSDVTGALAGYRVINDQTVSVTINVTRADPSRPVDCIVRAKAADGSETGRREVLIPPSQDPTVTVTTTVASSRPPVMGDIYGCGTDVPRYLRPS
jgi:hypothetical protein